MTNEISGSDKAFIFVGALVVICICFIAAQIRGCAQDANLNIKTLAEQGIRAEMSPSGNIRVLDTRDFRASKEVK